MKVHGPLEDTVQGKTVWYVQVLTDDGRHAERGTQESSEKYTIMIRIHLWARDNATGQHFAGDGRHYFWNKADALKARLALG